MTPARVATVGDAVGIVVALWVLAGPALSARPAGSLLDILAAAVLLLSLWRLRRRYRTGP